VTSGKKIKLIEFGSQDKTNKLTIIIKKMTFYLKLVKIQDHNPLQVKKLQKE
jgi:hypothetical protein